MSNELTNVDDTNTTVYYIPKAGFQGSNTTTNDMRASTTAANFSTSGDNRAKVQYAAVSNTGSTNPQGTGYYNFYTATLGFTYYNNATTGNSTRGEIMCQAALETNMPQL